MPFEEGPSGDWKEWPREKTELRERAAEEMGLSTERATIEPSLEEFERLSPGIFDKKTPITMETAYNVRLMQKWNVDSIEDAKQLEFEELNEDLRELKGTPDIRRQSFSAITPAAYIKTR